MNSGTHVPSHGYVKNKDDTVVCGDQSRRPRAWRYAERGRGSRGKPLKVVWPDESEPYEAPEIGYGHTDES